MHFYRFIYLRKSPVGNGGSPAFRTSFLNDDMISTFNFNCYRDGYSKVHVSLYTRSSSRSHRRTSKLHSTIYGVYEADLKIPAICVGNPERACPGARAQARLDARQARGPPKPAGMRARRKDDCVMMMQCVLNIDQGGLVGTVYIYK